MPRVNKSKKQIVTDIKLAKDAERRRKLIKEVIFPFLVATKEPIGYTKIFVQSFSSLVTGTFDELGKKMTIGDLSQRLYERLSEIFTSSDPEQKKESEKYAALIKLLKDVPIQDLVYAAELPRYIDGYFTQVKDKDTFDTITKEMLDKIMGK